MMLTICLMPRACVNCQHRWAKSIMAGMFKSGSPPKNVSTSRLGRTVSSWWPTHWATRSDVWSDIFGAGRPPSTWSPWKQ